MPQEIPTLTCRHLDVGCERSEALRAATVKHLLAEMACVPDAASVGYRAGRRWVRRYQPVELPAAPAESLPLRSQGLYLITGGLGNLGLTIADSLVSACKARLILTSRSGLPARAEWNDEAASWRGDLRIDARVRLMQDFERRGGEVLVAAVDTMDGAAMAALVAQAERQWGPLRGVIHAAGVMSGNGFRGVQDLRAEDCEELFGPKIRGTLALTEALGARKLDFCMLVSSLSAVLGGLGNGAYASANAYLDAFAASRRSDEDAARWITANWDQWGFGGEVAQGSVLARLAMTPQEGIDAYCRILAAEEVQQVVVSTADLEARLAQWVNPAAARRSDAQAEGATEVELHERPELDSAYVGPRNAVEEQIAQLWVALLAIERVGIHDNFIDLGGHSLMAAQLLARLRGKYQVELSLDDVFRRPTVAEQAALVAERSAQVKVATADASLMERLAGMSEDERKALLAQARAGERAEADDFEEKHAVRGR
jgi:NAD(P)-dependent dehydrogenase (short-subunit alcohol dehydrogenase family)/acyl carrier protein